MIAHEPNRSWVRDIRHLGANWTLRRLTRVTLITGVYAVIMSVLILRLRLEGRRPISGTFSLLGIILGIILVFRTNTAYDRWWEGRKLWGSIVNSSRNLAIQLDGLIPAADHETRSSFAYLIAGFALALSGQLRGEADSTSPVGAEPDGQGEPSPKHVPARIARAIIRRIGELHQPELSDDFDGLAIKYTHALLDAAGACERISKTPIPFSYSVFIRLFIVAYAAVLPIGLVPEYGYLAVPLVMLIIFALLGLELMAAEIEDPFGFDCNDLPTRTIADLIRADSAELLGVDHTARMVPDAPYSRVF
jgi:putative membrane protein